MNIQDKSFHKAWINNIQSREKINNNNFNIYKYVLKIIIILLILFTVLIIFRWWKKIPNVEILNLNLEQSLKESDTLIKPILLFKNKNNKVITVEALTAKKNISDSKIIILEKPQGEYQLSNKKNIYFYSSKGILDSNKDLLELLGNVVVNTSKGTNFLTNKLLYTMKENIITSDDIINVDGSWGKLVGKGFKYNIENSIISLRGRPKLSLNNNKGNIQ
ncbi:MAG: LPS export ABC transporter periplasmic protein LptC [Alphaproteobacteria bacterium]|nr:LPS export ABC transporter periplasmic protein LptC [Alphaproteobacteria bacterium]